jgi:hypothetical protein
VGLILLFALESENTHLLLVICLAIYYHLVRRGSGKDGLWNLKRVY